MKFKTFAPTPADIHHEWLLVDARGQTLGRLASQIARILRGKHKSTYAPNTDMGDFVVVVNCDKIHVTGKRLDQKIYYRHTGYSGGIKSTRLRDMMKRNPERVLYLAVKGMLPKNALGHQMIRKLKVYAGAQHPHEGQKPRLIEL
jgi:large subunit ribosomal protein L13